MPVPTSSELKTAIINQLGSNFKYANTPIPTGEGGISKDLDDYLAHLCGAIAQAWSNWKSTVKFGGVAVSGSGIGTWTGYGNGGVFDRTLQLSIGSFFNVQGEQILTSAIASRFAAAFNEWVGSFVFVGVQYTGTSTATAQNPGTFTAQNVPTPLSSSGTTTQFNALGSSLRSDLTGFDLSKGLAGEFVDALAAGLKAKFDAWRSSTMIVSNTVTGAAAAGSGSGSGTSLMNGIVQ
jgi:hypothetical protein